MYFSEKLKEERELGRCEGKQEKLVSQIRNLLNSSYNLELDIEDLANILGADKEQIQFVKDLIKYNPDKTDEEISRIFVQEKER